jgi:hypothetical protein
LAFHPDFDKDFERLSARGAMGLIAAIQFIYLITAFFLTVLWSVAD